MNLFPFDLQILHYTGAFNYSVYSFLFFLGKLFIIVLSPAIVLFAYLYYKRITRRKIIYSTHGKLLFGLCAIGFALVNFIAIREAISKSFYVIAYRQYIKNDFNGSAHWFFWSWKVDKEFQKPLHEILRLARDVDNDNKILSSLQDAGRTCDDPNLLSEIGVLSERTGMVNEAIHFFQRAYKFHPTPELSLDIARNYLENQNVIEARKWMKDIAPDKQAEGVRQELKYFRALTELREGNVLKGEKIFEEEISKDEIIDERVALLGARIYRKLGRAELALKWLRKAQSINAWNSDIYKEMAEVSVLNGELDKAVQYFKKELYYDNKGSYSFAVLQQLSTWKRSRENSMLLDNSIQIELKSTGNSVQLGMGEKRICGFKISGVKETSRFTIGILEPFGFGIRTEGLHWEKRFDEAGRVVIEGEFLLVGKRSNKCNLGKSWLLNIVYVDLEHLMYSGRKFPIDVRGDGIDKGRVLYVITEDHEQASGLPHRRYSKTNRFDPTMSYEDTFVDLIGKGVLAEEIASETGIRWSHIIDVGSSILRLQWLYDAEGTGRWKKLWPDMRAFMSRAVREGHDIQLHIHANNIPDNRLFRQYYNAKIDSVCFFDNIVRVSNDYGTHGAWSENYASLGNYKDVNSRTGSLFRGVKLLESELHDANPSYRTIFFRAGEYEFGFDRYSRRKSILAMKRNNLLAGSNAFDGAPGRRDFKFFRPIGFNVYFTANDDNRMKADSLENVGVLEMLPVPQKSQKDYIMPVGNWEDVKFNYDLCVDGDKVKKDVFVLMEMFHIHNINADFQWDRLQRDYEDWRRIAEHFAKVKASCPKLEFVTVSEAAKIYLDAYTPEIIALRSNEKKIREREYVYEILFLGKDIDADPAHRHWVSVKPPSYFVGRIEHLTINDGKKVVLEKTAVDDYDDIVFQIDKKKNYSMRILLN